MSQKLRPLAVGQLGPCGFRWIYFTHCQQLTLQVKTWGASCIGGFGQNDGLGKLKPGMLKSRGAPCIRGASCIGDLMVVCNDLCCSSTGGSLLHPTGVVLMLSV